MWIFFLEHFNNNFINQEFRNAGSAVSHKNLKVSDLELAFLITS